MLSQNKGKPGPFPTSSRPPLAEGAEDFFRQGHNCCESIIRASIEILGLPLPPDTYLLGRFFRQGAAESGCICGALAGGLMILGYLEGPESYSLSKAKWLQEQFTQKYGTTCCRVLRRQQSLADRLRNKACREITGFVAGLLAEVSLSAREGSRGNWPTSGGGGLGD